MTRLRSGAEDAVGLGITAVGLVLFLAPLALGTRFPQAVALFTALVAASALTTLAVALHTHRLSTRLLVALAALVAIDATLRLVVVVGLLGFSPIFFLIIVGGFVMGPGFGFASGALTLLLSAVITAGLGPWLPYQMLAAGWVGMGAGYVGRLPRRSPSPATLALLALYAGACGFGYGILLDLWEWPLLLGSASSPISWAPGLDLGQLLKRFGAFYLLTSLVYDGFRALGNMVLILALGAPVIAALERFRRRFLVEWSVPAPAVEQIPAKMHRDVGTPA
jgi:energy-coupling factor transport system substrate-specific component